MSRRRSSIVLDDRQMTLAARPQHCSRRLNTEENCWDWQRHRMLASRFTRLQGQYLAFVVAHTKLNDARRPKPASSEAVRNALSLSPRANEIPRRQRTVADPPRQAQGS